MNHHTDGLRRCLLGWGLAVLTAGLAGCGGSGDSAGSGGGSGPAGSGGTSSQADAGTLRLPQFAEPTTLDPAQVEDGPTIELLMQVYEGLLQWNEKNELVPCLAEKWDVSNGGKTYTFHLRKGAKFHNGREVTAADFAFSIQRSLDPKLAPKPSTVSMTYLNDLVGATEFHDGKATSIKGVEVVDDHTLRLTIDAPKSFFLAKLTYPTAYAACKEEIEKTGGAVTDASMIGTGAFKLTEYRKGDRIILSGNADYWGGAPKLARMERRIVLDNQTRHDKFEAGELDLSDVSMQTYRADKDNAKFQPLLKTFERPAVYYLALNQNAFPPFKDRRVRQAFAHAIDKSKIIASVHQGLPRQAEGIIPFGVPGYDPNFKGLPFDPARAKQLLTEAGFPEGKGFPPFKLSFRASVDDIKNTAVAIAGQLQENLGIQVELDETEWATFLTRRARGEMPCYFLRWMADYLDPQNFVSTMLHSKAQQNSLGYSNPEYDRLSEQADVMQDAKKRMETYRKAEAIAVADAPWVPIYFQKDVELWSPRLKGVEDMLLGHLPHKRTELTP